MNFSRQKLFTWLLVSCSSLDFGTGQGEELAPSQCPLIPPCCEEDCCGPSTSWVNPNCVYDPSSGGWESEGYSSDFDFGCLDRVCCEADCCDGTTTIYDATTQFCIPLNGNNSPPPTTEPPTIPPTTLLPTTPPPTTPPPSMPEPSPEPNTTLAPVSACTVPYKGWMNDLPDIDKKQGVSISVDENTATAGCIALLFLGWPGGEPGITLQIEREANNKEKLSDKCKYALEDSQKVEVTLDICGVGGGGGGGYSDTYTKQGCLSCDMPNEYECSLDDVAGKAVETIKANYDGCDSTTENQNGFGKVFKRNSLDRTKFVQTFNEKAGKFVKIAGEIKIEFKLQGDVEALEEDGLDCRTKQACPRKDVESIFSTGSGSIAASGSATLLKGWAKVSSTIKGGVSLRHRLDIDRLAGRNCISSTARLDFELDMKATLKIAAIFWEVWGRRITITPEITIFDGTVVTLKCFSEVKLEYCVGEAVPSFDPEVKCPEFKVLPRLTGGRRLTELTDDDIRERMSENGTLIITNEDIPEDLNFTLDHIEFSDVPLTCEDLDFQCGQFSDGFGDHECGTCADEEICLGTDTGGLRCLLLESLDAPTASPFPSATFSPSFDVLI